MVSDSIFQGFDIGNDMSNVTKVGDASENIVVSNVTELPAGDDAQDDSNRGQREECA